jgi:HSP20 family protein
MTRILVSRLPTIVTAVPGTEPWGPVDRLFNQLSHEFFSSFGPVEGAWPNLDAGAVALPRADVEDKGDSFEIRADIPGVTKDKIDVRVQGNLVTISAENNSETTDDSKTYVRRERTYQGFQRSLELPEPVVADKVQAQYRDGVLHVTVPKAHPVTEQKVKVE